MIIRVMASILLLSIFAAGLPGYTPKWDRVKPLAVSLFEGTAGTPNEAARRLQLKEEIIEILYEQEADYPIVYVDKKATGANNGTSWENAFTKIQDAIWTVYNQESEGWVWVAAGNYAEASYSVNIEPNYTLDGGIVIPPNVMVFGGFNGTETNLDERNYEDNVTIVRGWVGDGGGGLRGVDMGPFTLIDGFTVKSSGYVYSLTTGWGGKLAQDIAGGGIRTRDWLSIIRNNVVTANHAKGGGGISAMNRYGYSNETMPGYSPIIDRNLIYDNHAVCGAGAQLRHSEVLFCHNIVVDNTHLPPDNGATKHKGIEVLTDKSKSNRPLIVNTIIWGHPWKNLYDYPYAPSDEGSHACYSVIEEPYDKYSGGMRYAISSSNPLFVNRLDKNYKLSPTSPCLGAGLPLPDGTPTDIGFYEQRYLLTIDDGGIGADQTGEGWQIEGEWVTISTDSEFVDSAGTTRYLFQRWDGEGPGAYSGTERMKEIQVNGEITETITWDRSYALEIHSDTDTDQLSGWYPDQSSVQVVIPSRLAEADVRRVFSHWDMESDGTVTTSTDTSLEITMTQPVVLTAVWETEYRVDIASSRGSPTPSGEQWIVAGTDLTVSVETLVAGGAGTQYRFQQWEGDGSSAYTGDEAVFTVTINDPVKETAVWQTEYYLTVISEQDRGSPQGEKWYAEGASAFISVDSVVADDSQNRYRFSRWAGSGYGYYAGPLREKEIVIHNPLVQTVIWQRECPVDVMISPENRGHVVKENVTDDGWGIFGEQISLKAEGDADNGYGFSGWSGQFSGRENPLLFQMSGPVTVTANFELGDVEVKTEPAGLSITVGSADFSSPRIFYWLPDETYTLGTPSPQQPAVLTRYIFDHWSDGQAQQHQVVIPEEPVIYTAYFQPEYRVSVETAHGLASVQGNGWHAPGSEITVSIDSLADEEDGTRYRFAGWTSESENGVNASTRSISIFLQAGVIQQAHWQAQHLLDISVSPPYGGHVTTSVEGPWYDAGTSVQLTAVPVDTHFHFTGWSGDVQSDLSVISVTMDQPKQLTAQFYTHSVFSPEISGFADTTLLEDGEIVWMRSRIEKIVHDKNDPIDSLQICVKNEAPFLADWDGTALHLAPDPDWNGTAQVVLEVADPRELTALDTLNVTVISRPDPPKPFSLIQPENHAELPDSAQMVTFIWQTSRNVDAGDAVNYEFLLGVDSTFKSPDTWHVPSIPDTFLVLNRNALQPGVYWSVRAVDQQGYVTVSDVTFYCSLQTDVEQNTADISHFALAQNYPNPFNAGTQILYQLPYRSEVRLSVYDARGREIRTLVRQPQAAGQYQISWDAKDQYHMDLPSGIYLMKLFWGGHTIHKKMLLIR